MSKAPAIKPGRFALLFAVMLVAAAGNTAMQSLMPSIGRELGVHDLWVAAAFSLSALLWVLMAPIWARRADRRGRRALMRLGLVGFIVSMLICGLVIALGIARSLTPLAVFLIFVVGRSVYGAFGSASPPAVQAYVAARTDGLERVRALTAIGSSFGLGTILGPALAPLFVVAPLGLSGPLFAFAAIGALVLAALAFGLPDDSPSSRALGQVIAYPSIGGGGTADPPRPPDAANGEDARRPPLRWRDPRIAGWLALGTIGGHGHAAMLGVIGFLVIDRLGLPPAMAQQWIAIVLMGGAGASLIAQWGLIPLLGPSSEKMIAWGALLAAAGSLIVALASGVYGTAIGFALTSLGFGFFRPGFTSGASLAVGSGEQNQIAGMVTSVNGVAFVAAPAIGIALYSLWRPLPFLLICALMLGLAGWAWMSEKKGPARRTDPEVLGEDAR